MIHGRWLKGTDDLSSLMGEITDKDIISWHLIVDDSGKVSKCSLTPFIDGFMLRELSPSDDSAFELMLRMIGAKLDDLGKKPLYADKDDRLLSFGFIPFKVGILKAERLVLPKHCKE